MSKPSKLRALIMTGVLAGGLLALVSPPKEVQAEGGGGPCSCNDSGTGSYACNSAQSACIYGTEKCVLTCT